jgi:TetR/AcrR family transcriptional repressor of mexJK operon
MPPRDEQDFEARRQQIIDGAMKVFSREGFEKATNKDIAEAAHIKSPGLIYHYFKDKTDLFRQVVEERATVLQFIAMSDELMDREPGEVLTMFARAFFNMLNNPTSVAMFKLLLSEATRKPAIASIFNKIGPWRGFSFLNRYLEHQMDLGRLKRMNPGAASRCFMGPLVAFMLTREVFVQADSAVLDDNTMITTAVDIFLNGMAVSTAT